MRPSLVAYLNRLFQSDMFAWLIPTSSQVYALAFLAAAFIFYVKLRHSGNSSRDAWNFIWLGGLGAFLGAKLLFVLLHLHSYMLLPAHVFAPGGSVSFGAYGGALAAIWLYARHRGAATLPVLDTLAASLPLGTAIGRWSCFLNGDDFGKVTQLIWSVRYPRGSYAFAEHVHEGMISHTAALSAPVHPNQIYLSLNALLIFILLTWVWKRWRRYPGLPLSLYAFSYSLTRFFLEFFRDEPPVGWFPPLIFPQVVCLVIVGISFMSLIYLLQKHQFIHVFSHKNSLSQKGESYEAISQVDMSGRYSGTNGASDRL